jgi:hypothetical protein
VPYLKLFFLPVQILVKYTLWLGYFWWTESFVFLVVFIETEKPTKRILILLILSLSRAFNFNLSAFYLSLIHRVLFLTLGLLLMTFYISHISPLDKCLSHLDL